MAFKMNLIESRFRNASTDQKPLTKDGFFALK